MEVNDGLRNLVSNLGTSRDKAFSSDYVASEIDAAQLQAMYRGAWLPRKIVDIPARDAVRNWRAWQANADQITAIEAEETRLGVIRKVMQALINARLYGGAGIYIAVGQGDVQEPLRPESIGRGGVRSITVLNRSQLAAAELDYDLEGGRYGLPLAYRISSSDTGVQTVHHSRVIPLIGSEVPWVGYNPSGWGDSVLMSTLNAIRDSDATSGNVASLVFEAKVDVLHIPRLMETLREGGEDVVLKRLQAGAVGKGINGTLVLDGGEGGEGPREEYEQKSLNFSGLPDVMMTFFQQVSGAADIPMTRLFGRSAAGMNATGEGDERNYFDMIQSHQKLELGPAMAVFDECLIRSALGSRPADIHYTWNDLKQTSDRERADVLKTVADSARALAGNGGTSAEIIPVEVLGKAVANRLVEDGVLPGLEDAMEEFEAAEPSTDPDPDDIDALPPRSGNQNASTEEPGSESTA